MSINAKLAVYLSEGQPITYKGTPNTCTYWELVGVVAMVEGLPVGSLSEKIIVSDNDGLAVNQYIPSTNPADVGKVERVKVSEGA